MGERQDSTLSLAELNPLTEDIIELEGLEASELCFVKQGDEVLGPFSKTTIKDLISQDLSLADLVLISEVDQKEFLPPFEIPYFDRRNLSLASEPEDPYEDDKIYEYFLLKDGQKDGPFSVQEIKDKLKSKEILLSDSCLPVNSSEWLKISHIEDFNRREGNPTLPKTPKLTGKILPKASKDREEDALVGLAFYGQVHNDKVSDRHLGPEKPIHEGSQEPPLPVNSLHENTAKDIQVKEKPMTQSIQIQEVELDDDDEEKKKGGIPWPLIFRALFFTGLLVAILYITQNMDKFFPQKDLTKPAVKKEAKAPTKKKKKLKAKKIKGKSFKETKNYKKKQAAKQKKVATRRKIEAQKKSLSNKAAPTKTDIKRETLDPEIVDPNDGPGSEDDLFEEEIRF